ncbi:hypothetical protein C2134_01450 [Chromobacterium sinusclupearum]|uniref:DUF2844 domain-containing protein n=1 Tax=Chromobacterium sinusclupearum TaxID=2077146 RepID=A0A2K4MTN0_9NEIS|nr:hypothetical protein C2134_01450 [Chromobacterium sinusclupearum]
MKRPCLFVFLLALLAPGAHAALGQKFDAPAASAAGHTLLATRPAVIGGAYTVQDSLDASGRQIRQYVSLDGTVFAVAWSGQTHPDLQSLLGDYFPAFQQAQRNNRSGRNVLRGQVGSFVVHSYGRMGAFNGFAYDSTLLPAGVTPDQLK